MRIIAGRNRSIRLDTLEGNNTRPTLDRVKEALFSSLENYIEDYENVLDLFAGSGALGLECNSRFESNVTFVDKSNKAIRIIKNNIKKCKAENCSNVYNMNYKEYIKKAKEEGAKFDIIFLDPPYIFDGHKIIQEIIDSGITKENTITVYETDDEKIVEEINNDEKITILKTKKYGRVFLNYITT